MKNQIIILITILLTLIIPRAVYSINTGNPIDKKIAELEKQLTNVSGKEKIDTLNRLAAITYTGGPKKCVSYCNQVLDLTKQIQYPRGKAMALLYLSYALGVLGDWKTPFEYSKEALAIFEKQEDSVGIGKALVTIGYFYERIDYYNIALDYHLRSLKMFEKVGEKNLFFLPYMSLGNLYYKLEDYPQALEYYKKAGEAVKGLENDSRIPQNLHNIGLCCHRMGKHQEALAHYREALGLFEKIGLRYWIAVALSNIGTVYGDLNQPRRALSYLSRARRLRETIGDKVGLFYTLCHIGDTYMKLQDYPRVFLYYNRARKIAEKLDDKDNLEKIHKSFADYYAAVGDYKNAFENHKMYCRIRETLFNKQKNKQITELHVQFETEKKAKEIEILKKDNKIQVITKYASIIGFILVSVILILLFNKYLYLLAFWKKQKYIGRYRLEQTIGSGGVGTVYRARSIRNKNELAAVKVLKEELMEDESSRQRFKHEGTVIEKLSHANIVKIFERGEYKSKLYIAMEYLQGKTLARKIAEVEKIDLKECFDIMMQVTDALAYIHGKCIVHRDLKPANIMLVPGQGTPGAVKLLDFGVALMKFQTRLTQTGMLVGTIHYIAPEQITDNLYSAAGDVYALGVTFYEMLVGKSAFTANTITAVVEKILDDVPVEPMRLRPDIPETLNRLIMQMLEKKPARRPLAADVLTALKKMEQTAPGGEYSARDTRGTQGTQYMTP